MTTLLGVLERRRERGLQAEHRLARERKTLDLAIRKLRVGFPEAVVKAELEAAGLALPVLAAATQSSVDRAS